MSDETIVIITDLNSAPTVIEVSNGIDGEQGPIGPQGNPGVDGDAFIDDFINDGVTNRSASQNAVFDALAGKENAIAVPFYQVLGSDGSGGLTSIPGWSYSADTNAAFWQLPQSPDGTGGANMLNLSVGISPVAASVNDSFVGYYSQINFDVGSSGFDQGTSGTAATHVALNSQHHGTGDIGSINFISSYAELGNGTDPIDVRGFGYAFGFANVNANVNISGAIQGYGFQPSFDPASTLGAGAYISAFYDYANMPIAVNSYTSFVASPIIGSVNNNNWYTGLNLAPTIGNFLGNAGMTGYNISPTITSMDTGGFTGVNINPNIGSMTSGGATGIYVNMSNVSGPNVKAMEIVGDVSINGALAFTGALSIGQLQAYYPSIPIESLDGNPQGLHGLVTAMTAQNGTTVANADAIGVNTAMLITLEPNSVTTSGPFNLGLAALALPCVVETHTGATLDFMNAAVYAINLSGGSTGGTIDVVNLCRTVAVPNGITTINKLRAYAFDLPFGDPGSTTWGVYMAPTVPNFMAGSLRIGGTPDTDDLPDSGVTLHVEGDTYLVGNVGFFGTSPVGQQIGGVATAGGTYTATEQTMLQAVYDAMRNLGLMN